MTPVLSFVAGVLVGMLCVLGGLGLIAAIAVNLTRQTMRKVL